MEKKVKIYTLDVLFAKNQPMLYNLRLKEATDPNTLIVVNLPSYMGTKLLFGRFGGIKCIKVLKNKKRLIKKNEKTLAHTQIWKAIVTFTSSQGLENILKHVNKSIPVKLYNRQTLPLKDYTEWINYYRACCMKAMKLVDTDEKKDDENEDIENDGKSNDWVISNNKEPFIKIEPSRKRKRNKIGNFPFFYSFKKHTPHLENIAEKKEKHQEEKKRTIDYRTKRKFKP